LVGQAGAAVTEAGVEAGADGEEDAAGADGAVVARDDTADEAVEEADAAADEAAVVVLAGGDAADDDAPAVHPATPIPTTTTAAATPATPVCRRTDLVEPTIANLISAAQTPQLSVTWNHTVYTPSKDAVRLAMVGRDYATSNGGMTDP
jgi:hypothetical protein